MSGSADGGLHVVGLEVERVKRITAISIHPQAVGVVKICGKNAAGKSSVLDAIEIALRGAEAMPALPIQRGADSAKIEVDLGEIRIRRRMRGNESTLEVLTHEGKSRKPQGLIDALLGLGIGFDPVAWCRSRPAEQVRVLMDLTGYDRQAFDRRRAALYDKRTEVNRALKEARATLASLPALSEEQVRQAAGAADVSARIAELAERERTLLAAQSLCVAADEAVTKARAALQAEIAQWERTLAARRQEIARLESEAATARESLQRLEEAGLRPEPGAVQRMLEESRAAQEVTRVQAERTRLAERVAALELESSMLTMQMEEVDQESREALVAAPFPVESLNIESIKGEYCVTYRGIPIQDCAASEQIRVGMAIAAATNPRIRVVLIRDASLLDAEQMAVLERLCAEKNLQCWCEIVGEGDESAWVIQDGGLLRAPEA